MGKPVLKNENDVERWRALRDELFEQMKKDGLTPAETAAIVTIWCDEYVGGTE